MKMHLRMPFWCKGHLKSNSKRPQNKQKCLEMLWPSSNQAISRRRRWWLGILRKWLAAGKSISRSLGAIPASDWWIGRAIDVWRGGAALPSFQSPTQSISPRAAALPRHLPKSSQLMGRPIIMQGSKGRNLGEEHLGAISLLRHFIPNHWSWIMNSWYLAKWYQRFNQNFPSHPHSPPHPFPPSSNPTCGPVGPISCSEVALPPSLAQTRPAGADIWPPSPPHSSFLLLLPLSLLPVPFSWPPTPPPPPIYILSSALLKIGRNRT